MKKKEEMIRKAVDLYVRKEDEKIRKEMEEVEEIFKKMAKECYNKIFENPKTQKF